MRRALPLLSLLIVGALAGCGEKPIAHAHRPKRYKTVISLSPGTTEIISSDGDVQTLKGRTAADNFPSNIVAPIPIVASVKPDYEKIQSMHPDLIVYDKGLYSDQDIDKLKTSGADLFAIDANTVDDFVKELYELGSLLGWETRFNDYTNRIVLEKNAALADPYKPAPKVSILMPSAGGADMITGTDSFLGDVVKIAGGQLVGPKSNNFGPLNAEAFVAQNPDVILVTGSKTDTSGVTQVMNDPRFKTISAVKNQRVFPVDSDVLLRRGQRVDQLIKAVHYVLAPSNK